MLFRNFNNFIRDNYDDVVKPVAALKTGTAEADVIIKRFSKDNYNHPLYKALMEIGHAVKTIFFMPKSVYRRIANRNS